MNEPTSDRAAATEPAAALRSGAAWLRRPGVAPWRMTGEDRARFLNGLVTCAVQELPAGEGTYGFVTSAKGRVLADLVVLAAADRFLLELPLEAAQEARDHLLRYRIADRVDLEPWIDHSILTVAGPDAATVLADLVDEVPKEGWRHREATVAGVAVRLARRDVAPVAAWDLWLATEDAAAVSAALTAAGAAESSVAAWEAARVNAGVPRFGVDFGPSNLPQETGLGDRAVSYEKGCYLGQEVVARIHYRGGVNKGLVGLELDAPGGAAPGAEIAYEGRAAGRLGSVSPMAGEGDRALAILHQRAAEPGTVVEVAGAGGATVRALPF